jgi:hypothetical protein
VQTEDVTWSVLENQVVSFSDTRQHYSFFSHSYLQPTSTVIQVPDAPNTLYTIYADCFDISTRTIKPAIYKHEVDGSYEVMRDENASKYVTNKTLMMRGNSAFKPPGKPIHVITYLPTDARQLFLHTYTIANKSMMIF